MPNRLEHIGRLRAAARWKMAAHTHPFHQLIYVLRGRIGVDLGGQRYSGRPGEFLLYPAQIQHTEWAETVGLETIYIGFEWEVLPAAAPRHGIDARERLRSLLEWIYADRDARLPEAIRRRQTLIEAFVAELQSLLATPPPGLVARIRAYVRAHLADPIQVEDLAALVHLSKFHFIRTFTAEAGVTPMTDVRALRLDAARHRILTTDLPLKTIAPEVGIASEYHLSRLLTAHFGAGPRLWRGKSGG